MSRKIYTAADIAATEKDILLALDWHVNPPTVFCFCQLFLGLFPLEEQEWDEHSENDPQPKRSIAWRQCEHLSELSLDDVFFLDKAASIVGLAVVVLVTNSLRNETGGAAGRRRCRGGSLNAFLQSVQGIVNVRNAEFDSVLRRLECLL